MISLGKDMARRETRTNTKTNRNTHKSKYKNNDITTSNERDEMRNKDMVRNRDKNRHKKDKKLHGRRGTDTWKGTKAETGTGTKKSYNTSAVKVHYPVCLTPVANGKIFNQKSFNYFVWTLLDSRVNR